MRASVRDLVLERHGVIYGVRMNSEMGAVHARAVTKAERDPFRGSKYVQSNIGTAYEECHQDLVDGSLVLFSGTPCQIDGLNQYLAASSSPTDRLVTVEILCYGVPSPRVLKDYLRFVGNGKDVSAIDFRDKKRFGWKDHVETVTVNGKQISSRNYATLFLGHNILRPSCFKCPYKNTERLADITLGDYWGIDELDRSFNDNKGVSLVIIQSEKGKQLFHDVSASLSVEGFLLANSLQEVLIGNYAEPSARGQFWKDYEIMPFEHIVRKYGTDRKKDAKRFVKKLLAIG